MLTLIGDGDPSEGDPRGVIGLVRGLFVPEPSGGRPREREQQWGRGLTQSGQTLVKDVSPLDFLHQFYFGPPSGRTGGIITAESVVSSAS